MRVAARSRNLERIPRRPFALREPTVVIRLAESALDKSRLPQEVIDWPVGLRLVAVFPNAGRCLLARSLSESALVSHGLTASFGPALSLCLVRVTGAAP